MLTMVKFLTVSQHAQYQQRGTSSPKISNICEECSPALLIIKSDRGVIVPLFFLSFYPSPSDWFSLRNHNEVVKLCVIEMTSLCGAHTSSGVVNNVARLRCGESVAAEWGLWTPACGKLH